MIDPLHIRGLVAIGCTAAQIEKFAWFVEEAGQEKVLAKREATRLRTRRYRERLANGSQLEPACDARDASQASQVNTLEIVEQNQQPCDVGDTSQASQAPSIYIRDNSVLTNTVVVKERKKVSKSARASSGFAESQNEFLTWYQDYPHKVGRAAAKKSFDAARKKASMEDLISGLEAYKATKPAYQAWAHPSTWLNQERWLDCPAEENPFLAKPLSGKPISPHLANIQRNAEIADATFAAIQSGELQINRSNPLYDWPDGGGTLGATTGKIVPLHISHEPDAGFLGGDSVDLHGVPGARRGNRL